MIRAHTVAQIREAEERLMATLPDGVLMQRAAYGLAMAILDLLGTAGGSYGRRVLLLVGPGNNGGDALYAGEVLARRGVAVDAWLLADQVHAEGLAALRRSGGTSGHHRPPHAPDVVVDGIVGIGGRPGLRPDAVAALENLDGVTIVAVDIPSGVGVDSGELDGPHVTADLTVTFGTHKPALLVDPAAHAAGGVHLVDIGLDLPEPDLEALQPDDVARLLPRPAADTHKYTRGVVGLRCGSTEYPGAGLLAVAGASCGLAGMVRYVGPSEVAAEIKRQHPEVVGAGRVQAWVVGSGGSDGAAAALHEALQDDVPIVVDADALPHVSSTGRDLVLTPHAGELSDLSGVPRAEIEARPLHFARAAAAERDAVVLLKGHHTVIAAPDGRTRVTLTGTPWLATAGAGDVLSGVVGALLATGLDAFDAASVGSWLHGAAATVASRGGPITAAGVAAALPTVIGDLLEHRLLEQSLA